MDWARELNYEKERGYSIGYDTGLKSAKLEAAANLLKRTFLQTSLLNVPDFPLPR